MLTDLRPDHFTILTDDLQATEAFYTELLGLAPGPRPQMGSDGLWLYAGDYPMLHVVKVATLPAERRGVLDHMAFRAQSVEPLIAELERRGIDYRLIRTAPPWRQVQLFFDGPNGERVEVDADLDQH